MVQQAHTHMRAYTAPRREKRTGWKETVVYNRIIETKSRCMFSDVWWMTVFCEENHVQRPSTLGDTDAMNYLVQTRGIEGSGQEFSSNDRGNQGITRSP